MKPSKHYLKGLFIVFTLLLKSGITFSQVSNPNNTYSAGAYVGWSSGNNVDFKINTNQYMIIKGNGTNNGFVGIGTTAPTSLLHVDGQTEAFRTNVPASTSTIWRMQKNGGTVGYIYNNSGDNHFFISAFQSTGNVNLQAGGASTTVLTAHYNTNVGINSTTPGYKLDVSGGDVNTATTTAGYRIAGNYVLRHNNNVNNILVGVGAGNSTSGTYNTFVGGNAGFTNSTGSSCTFLGHVAGYSNTNAVRCTFLGDSAGYYNTTGRWNTFTGFVCGVKNVNGEANSFYGKHCGSENVSGNQNSYFGNHAAIAMIDGHANVMMGSNTAFYQQHGDSNTYVGANAAYGNSATIKGNTYVGGYAGYTNAGGDYNTSLGYKAGNANTASMTNTTAIGANTVVTASNKMILGNNAVNVGIGLSGVTSAPANKLEINAIAGNGTTDVDATTGGGASGLRFRDLTTASTVNTNSFNGVLSVNASGDVILVADQPTGSGIGSCASPTTFSSGAHGAINLNNNNNFYFIGNGGGNTVNNDRKVKKTITTSASSTLNFNPSSPSASYTLRATDAVTIAAPTGSNSVTINPSSTGYFAIQTMECPN